MQDFKICDFTQILIPFIILGIYSNNVLLHFKFLFLDILNWDRIPVGALDLDSGKITLVDPETFPEEDPDSREVQSSMGWWVHVNLVGLLLLK